METPDWLRQLAVVAVAAHPADIAVATDRLLARARRHPDFAALADAMIRDTLLHLIHDVRHQQTVKAKQPEPYLGKAKVERSRCDDLDDIYDRMRNYYINGTVLAFIKGEDMEELAQNEESLAGGHLLNARVLRRLRKLTPDGCTAGEKVKPKQFDRILREEQARDQCPEPPAPGRKGKGAA